MTQMRTNLLSVVLAALMVAWMPLSCCCGTASADTHHDRSPQAPRECDITPSQASHESGHCHSTIPPGDVPADGDDDAPGPCECLGQMHAGSGLRPEPILANLSGQEGLKLLSPVPDLVATATLVELDRLVQPPLDHEARSRPKAEHTPSLLALHCSLTI
ncbi:MAG: hypothetical protein WD118_01115 [Phycisphaeraceae bacterium]